RHTRSKRDWSSDVCSSDLTGTSARIMQLWDAPIRTRDSILIDSQQSYSAAFSPGEPRAVVSTSGKTAQIWSSFGGEGTVVLSGRSEERRAGTGWRMWREGE